MVDEMPDSEVGKLLCISRTNEHYCIDVYSYSCLHLLSNERKTMFKSGESRAV